VRITFKIKKYKRKFGKKRDGRNQKGNGKKRNSHKRTKSNLPEKKSCLRSVLFFKSRGTKSKRVIGRCWSLPKIWQQALKIDAHYAIEVISERYDTLNEKMKDEVILHELLHIPKGFGGGLRHHKQLKKALEELR